MKDPYVYEGTNVLRNNLSIQDEKRLIDIEAQIFIANFLDISSITDQLDFTSYKSLRLIHHFLFSDLYKWAGEFRTIDIYKSERALGGLSVKYSNENKITFDLKEVFYWSNEILWHYDNSQLTEDFSKLMTDLWRIHPFREGNTRTVSIFMNLFAEANELKFDGELLSKHPGYLREALVLAGVEENPETEHLLKILGDALNLNGTNDENSEEVPPEKYRVINQYDVSEYRQKPFQTDKDSTDCRS